MRSKLIHFIVLFLLISSGSIAQERRASPLTLATSRYKDTYVKIVYSQPQKKGREIFGTLVPFGEVWRTGANETTEITITSDIIIGGQTLKAGSYSIFTIPNPGTWTILFNADLGLWGAYNYNPKRDVLRFNVASSLTAEVTEAFTITINPLNNKAEIIMQWDKTKVILPIQYLEPLPKP